MLPQNVERLIVELLVRGFIAEDYQVTPYTINVYLKRGRLGSQFTMLKKEQVAKETKRIMASVVTGLDAGRAGAGKKRASTGSTAEKTSDMKAAAKKRASTGGSSEAGPSRSAAAAAIALVHEPAPAAARKKIKLARDVVDLQFSSDTEEDDGPKPRRAPLHPDNAPLKIVKRKSIAPSAILGGSASASPGRGLALALDSEKDDDEEEFIDDDDDDDAPLMNAGRSVVDDSSDVEMGWHYTTRG